MIRIVCDPSSGSIELYLNEIIRSGSYMFVVCLVGVWQRNFEPVVCVCTVRRAAARRTLHTHTHHWFKITLPNTDQAPENFSEPVRISVKYSSILPHDGSNMIRNMLE